MILYRFGFLLIESKSITGNVRVNKQEEWSRSYRDTWQGIPSPIKQVQLQTQLLKDLLHENRSKLVGTILGLQQTLDKRSWDHLCAVSSNAIVERDNMPSSISKKLVKSEFLVDAIVKIMDLKNEVIRVLSLLDNRPTFNEGELIAIRDFILEQCSDNLNLKSKKITDITPSNKTKTVPPTDDVYHPPKANNVIDNIIKLLSVKAVTKRCS